MNPIHTHISYFFKVHFNVILLIYLSLGLPSGLFPSGFTTELLYAFLKSIRQRCNIAVQPLSPSLIWSP
jgi:hypothetical protein